MTERATNESDGGGLRQWLKAIPTDQRWPVALAGLPIVASLVSWTVAVRFYAEFGISPGDVGIGPIELLAPAVVIGAAAAVAAALGHYLWDVPTRGLPRRPASGRPNVLANWRRLLFSVAIPASIVVARWSHSASFALLGTTAGIGLFLGAALRESGPRPNPWARAIFFCLAAAATLFVVPSLAVAVFASSATTAGPSATPWPLRLGPVARFVEVRSHVPELKSLESAACVIEMGTGPQGRVLVVAENSTDRARVVFANSQLVSTVSSGRCRMVLPTGIRMRLTG